jgi:hypothetical protein
VEEVEKIQFKLNKELGKKDDLGSDYVYTAVKHPTIEDIMVIHYEQEGYPYQANYSLVDVKKNFKEGRWMKL